MIDEFLVVIISTIIIIIFCMCLSLSLFFFMFSRASHVSGADRWKRNDKDVYICDIIIIQVPLLDIVEEEHVLSSSFFSSYYV